MEYAQKKFNREYVFTYIPATQEGYASDTQLVIKNPITINFNVKRDIFSAVNTLELDIYNLSKENRDFMYQDLQSQRAYCYLEAGYKGWAKSLIFAGNAFNTLSKRDGVNAITHVQAFDGYNALQAEVNQTLEAGSTVEDIVKLGQRTMQLDEGVYSFKNYKFVRPVELQGNAFYVINKYVNRNAYIDLGKLNIQDTNEVFEGEVLVIDDETGLIGTPERSLEFLTIKMIFEPRIQVGQLVELRSAFEPRYNGQYKVYGVSHSGTISDSVAGQATTTLQLWTGTTNFGGFSVINQSTQNITPVA